MNNEITNYITRSNQLDWTALKEEGVNTKGIFVKLLQYDESSKRAPVILLKFEAGAKYPYHNHPAGEHVFVLEGDAIFEGEKLSAGDYLYTPPNFKHEVTTESGCVLFFMIPQEVEIMER
jgi:quercetin dioxygenase-like cupin family protein